MQFLTILGTLAMGLVLLININSCYSATLSTNENNTAEVIVIAKTSTTIIDVFEDIRWFFGRLGVVCEVLEKMLPQQKRIEDQTQLSVNLQSGFRHFLLGVREISKSIVAVLSNKEVQEYQQLSRATDYAQEMVRSIGEIFRNLRLFAGKLFKTYNYYVPEVVLTKCIGNFLQATYAHRPIYEYPILLINDIIKNFQQENNTSANDRNINWIKNIRFEKNVEQNEILDEDIYVFHNTPVSPTPELAVPFGNEEYNRNPPITDDQLSYNEKSRSDWLKCFKIYATETIFRKLEFYFLEIQE